MRIWSLVKSSPLIALIAVAARAPAQTNPWLEATREMSRNQRAELIASTSLNKDAEATRLLVGALSDPEGSVILSALRELSRRRTAETFDILVELAPTVANKGGWEIMYELFRYPYPESKPWFEKNWEAKTVPARKTLTAALAMKAPRDDSFWRLIRRTRDPEGDVVWEVAVNIYRYREEKYQRAMLALLDHPNANTQAAMCLALGTSGAQFARRNLERKVRIGPDPVRWPAQEALLRLGPAKGQ